MKKKILFGVSLLFGLMYINSGLNKFFNYMPMPKDMPEEMMKLFGAFMEIGWLIPLIAVVEIVTGVLLTHLTKAPSGLPVALVLFAINVWVIIENREKYMPMLR